MSVTSRIVCANALDGLPFGDGSAQCCVTSPPYWGLRDYGQPGQLGLERTPDEYVARLVSVFREVRRVLRDDGVLWLNLGDSYAGGARSGPGLKRKDLCGMPWRVAFALQADGWWLRSDVIWHKPNPMPESVTDRPTKAHEYLFLMTKAARYFYDADAVREPDAGLPSGNGFAGRMGGARDTACAGGRGREARHVAGSGRNKRSVWTTAPRPYSGAHFAVMPPALVEPCIKAGSRAGDVVLDPFAGSGTTGAVAISLGRSFVGVELNPEYITLAGRRIGQEAAQLGLFGGDA